MSNKEEAPGQNKVSTIVVNGRDREVSGQKISYAEVVKLAFPNDTTDDSVEYTVAYANHNGKDGTLVSGQAVHVKEGMIFNVSKTNRS
jgi:hypothetical protein